MDLQVEKEHLLARIFRLNWDFDYGPIHFCAYEIQRNVDRFSHHPATASAIDWEEMSLQCDELDHGISVFTDGSKLNSSIGFGVAIYENGAVVAEKSYSLPPYAVVFQAELMAIAKALVLCGSIHASFSLFTDSMPSLFALSAPNSQNSQLSKIHELREALEIR